MQDRLSNIELLRIIAMCMIVGLHYFGMGDANRVLVNGTENYYLYHILESLCICGVDIFVLITGYFSISHDSIKMRKIVSLLVDVAFWGICGYCLAVLVGWKGVEFKETIKVALPILFNNRWFVKAYIILLLFAPFINMTFNLISKKSYNYLLLIFTCLFCIWPSFLPYPPVNVFGYGFMHFVFLYLIAGYISKFIDVTLLSSSKLVFAFLLMLLLVILSSFFMNMAWAYNYLFVVLLAIALFILFLKMSIKSRCINVLASCAFGVFLIHTSDFFGPLVYEKFFKVSESLYYSPLMLLLNFFVCIPVFYLFCFILEYTKKWLFGFSVDVVLRKIKDIYI